MKTQITLRLKQQPTIPVEAESITPESISGKDLDEIYCLPLWSGNRQHKLGDYFEVEMTEQREELLQPESNLARIILHGDLSRFKRLGQGMTAGEMQIQGSVGFHTGALMRGGKLQIIGDAGDWLGAHMEGGQITVEGSAGHFIGASYRGLHQGMTGGTILVHGNAGQMLGSRMRGGLIAVGGKCGDVPGFKMLAGTIIVVGSSGIRVGVNMIRGSIILLQPTELLPSFYYNCAYRPEFWGLLYKELQQKNFNLPDSYRGIQFKRYSGDAQEGGKGEILLCQSH